MQKQKEMSFIDHLEELRWHIFRSVVSIVISMVLCFVFKDILFESIIFGPQKNEFFSYKMLCLFSKYFSNGSLCKNDFSFVVVNLSMAGQFLTHLKVSFFSGLILAFPYISYEIWHFVKPGLYKSEKKLSILFMASCLFLFLSGVLFSYFVIAPISMQFLANYSVSLNVSNTISLESYIGFITSLVFAGGILFEMPIFVYFLAKAGIITDKNMRQYRKHAIIVILFLSALITPPDIASQVILSLPLLVLYELSILIAKNISKENI